MNADVFMICVAVNSQESFDNIERWKIEIYKVVTDVPIMLVLTKSDLQEMCDDAVTYDMIKQAKEEKGLQGHCQTSSKEW